MQRPLLLDLETKVQERRGGGSWRPVRLEEVQSRFEHPFVLPIVYGEGTGKPMYYRAIWIKFVHTYIIYVEQHSDFSNISPLGMT